MTTRAASVVVAALLVALAGCAPSAVSGEDQPMTGDALTLEVAKADAIALGEELASYFPAQYVKETRTIEAATTLLPCDGEERYGWPGRTTLFVSDVPDQAAALEPMAREWESRSGWRVERLTEANGHGSVDLEHTDGTNARVAFLRAGSEVWINVVSPCFHLPGGMTYGEEY